MLWPLAVAALIAGLGQARSAEQGENGGEALLTSMSYPRVTGSTSTRPLGQLVAARALGLEAELRRMPHVYMGRENIMLTFPLATRADRIRAYQTVASRIGHVGTHGSYVRLIEGGADLILVAREPSEDELKLARQKRVELDARPVALDAFVFLVNAANPVKSLTLDQLRDIYTGKVTRWDDVGGKRDTIRAFTRNRNSGSQELMEKLVMKGRKMIDAPDMMLDSMMGPIERVSQTPNGIGYSVYYYEHVMSPSPRNRLLAVGGVVPTSASIRARRYPLATEVFVATRRDAAPGSAPVRLRDWLLSPAGQQVVADSGYVPLPAAQPQQTLQQRR
jgi:phosphate transport system substrate-binding protein